MTGCQTGCRKGHIANLRRYAPFTCVQWNIVVIQTLETSHNHTLKTALNQRGCIGILLSLKIGFYFSTKVNSDHGSAQNHSHSFISQSRSKVSSAIFPNVIGVVTAFIPNISGATIRMRYLLSFNVTFAFKFAPFYASSLSSAIFAASLFMHIKLFYRMK